MTIQELLSKNKRQFLIYIFGVLLTTPTNLMITFAMAYAFTLFEVTSIQEITRVVVISFSLALSPIFLQLLSRYLRIGFMRDVLVDVRNMAYDKFLSTSPDVFKNTSKEKFQSELTSDINLFEADFFLSILNIVYSFGSFTLGLLVLIFISPLLAFATLAIAIVFFFLSKAFEKPSKRKKKAVQEQNTIYHMALSNVLRGLESIKLSKVEEKFKSKFFLEVNELESVKKDSFVLEHNQANLMQWLGSTFQILSYIYAAYLFSQGSILLPQMVVVLNLVGQLSWTLNSGFSFVNRFKTSIDVFRRITYLEARKAKTHSFQFNDEISISQLAFSYNQKKVFENLSFKIKKDQKLLLYGPSGSGKTTLLECISNNISNYEGKILYDHLNLNSISSPSFWRHVAYARQNHFIFNDSIKNNIILNKKYDQEIFDSIMSGLNLSDWLRSLEAQENHQLIQNGQNISGGQRQRISLARELYQDKEVLFLDEPSASLDDETARKVYQYILSLNKTVICVSHRHLNYLEHIFDHSINLEKKEVLHG